MSFGQNSRSNFPKVPLFCRKSWRFLAKSTAFLLVVAAGQLEHPMFPDGLRGAMAAATSIVSDKPLLRLFPLSPYHDFLINYLPQDKLFCLILPQNETEKQETHRPPGASEEQLREIAHSSIVLQPFLFAYLIPLSNLNKQKSSKFFYFPIFSIFPILQFDFFIDFFVVWIFISIFATHSGKNHIADIL